MAAEAGVTPPRRTSCFAGPWSSNILEDLEDVGVLFLLCRDERLGVASGEDAGIPAAPGCLVVLSTAERPEGAGRVAGVDEGLMEVGVSLVVCRVVCRTDLLSE